MTARRVLIVDDSPTTRRMVAWALSPMELEIEQAPDGRAALKLLEEKAVQAAVVDLNMPVMDGIELVRAVRAHPRFGSLPILMLTTEGREKERDLARDAGANLYLVKPSTPPEIRESVRALLGDSDDREGNEPIG